MTKSHIETLFDSQCKAVGLRPVRELKFHPERRWRFDFAFPDRMIAIECEGGVWSGGRHTRGAGFVADCEKYNSAAALGWFIFRFTGNEIKNGNAILFIREVLSGLQDQQLPQ